MINEVDRIYHSLADKAIPLDSGPPIHLPMTPEAKSAREAREQEKTRRFGLLPIKGSVDKLKNWKEQTT